MDPKKSLFVTGDVNVGRDPSNVNVWGNVTLTGIVDLTAGADPDEALLVRALHARWAPAPRTSLLTTARARRSARAPWSSSPAWIS